MKNSVRSGKKTWRHFKRPDRSAASTGRIRSVCIAALILEAAVWIRQNGLPAFFSVRVEHTQTETVVVPAGEEAGGILEQIFGVRLRFRDGAIEFYRQEEALEE